MTILPRLALPLGLGLAAACTSEAPHGDDPAVDDAFPADLAETLQTTLDTERSRLGAAGATLGVRLPSGALWVGASGLADVEASTPVTTDDRFRIGSITKTVHTTAVLRLVDQGLLSLDDTVADHIDTVPWGDRITIRDLLRHRSGIADYTDLIGYFVTHLDEPHTPDEIIGICVEEGMLYEPGTEARYSNTNFYVMARILETLTGDPFHTLVRDEVLEPLGLPSMYVEGPEETAGPPLVEGYLAGEPDRPLDPSWHWAAGGMVSDIHDLMAWGEALLDPDGAALTEAQRAAMQDRTPLPDGTIPDLGLGLRSLDTPCGEAWGHTGSTMGFQSDLFRLDDGTLVGVLMNDFVYEASDIAWAACQAVAETDPG